MVTVKVIILLLQLLSPLVLFFVAWFMNGVRQDIRDMRKDFISHCTNYNIHKVEV